MKTVLTNIKFMIVLCIIIGSFSIFASGCSKKKPQNSYAKEITIIPPTATESLFARLKRSYNRGNVDNLLDGISRDMKNYGVMAERTGRLFRRSEKYSLGFQRRLKKKGKYEYTYEIPWHVSFFDIYTNEWKTYKGQCYFKVSCGEIPKITSITGDNPFLLSV